MELEFDKVRKPQIICQTKINQNAVGGRSHNIIKLKKVGSWKKPEQIYPKTEQGEFF